MSEADKFRVAFVEDFCWKLQSISAYMHLHLVFDQHLVICQCARLVGSRYYNNRYPTFQDRVVGQLHFCKTHNCCKTTAVID